MSMIAIGIQLHTCFTHISKSDTILYECMPLCSPLSVTRQGNVMKGWEGSTCYEIPQASTSGIAG